MSKGDLVFNLRIDANAPLVPEIVRRDCVRAADRLQRLEELARAVIRKHAGAGLRGSHYDLVSMAQEMLKDG